jgi:4-alpha-glucanotransferase
VQALRDQFGFPGMRVLQFAFSGEPGTWNSHQPHTYPGRCVVYTGTHDNDTTIGWFRSGMAGRRNGAIGREQAHALNYLGLAPGDRRGLHWEMIRLALMSPANLAVMPMQDLLGLGSEARMNRPGIAKGNWAWRMAERALTEPLAMRLRGLTQVYGRLPARSAADASVRRRPAREPAMAA